MPPISVQESNLISKAKGGDADQQISSLKKAKDGDKAKEG